MGFVLTGVSGAGLREADQTTSADPIVPHDRDRDDDDRMVDHAIDCVTLLTGLFVVDTGAKSLGPVAWCRPITDSRSASARGRRR